MRNTFGLTGLALAAVVVIAPPSVAAGAPQASQPKQPQPQPPAITEQVEVVATRLAEPPHEVPAAIEVIAGDTLRAMNARTLPQALALASGVDVTGGGDAGPAGAVPEFRGLREFDAFLLVVDGIPWGGAFNPALTTLSLRDIDRVEILRGPADRKSTRLNSSHTVISYAVFCLKKKMVIQALSKNREKDESDDKQNDDNAQAAKQAHMRIHVAWNPSVLTIKWRSADYA